MSGGDYITPALARLLGISEYHILDWSLSVHRQRRGLICNELTVQLHTDRATMHKLHLQPSLGSLYIRDLRVNDVSLGIRAEVAVTLLYGKETQHIFKALHQTMTVRGRQKRKKRI